MRWHSADDASRLAALLLPRILPIFSVVAPGQPGASPPSVLRRIYEMSSSGLSTLIGALVALMVIRLFRGAQKGPDRWTPRGEPIDLTSHRRPTDALVYLLAVDGNVNPPWLSQLRPLERGMSGVRRSFRARCRYSKNPQGTHSKWSHRSSGFTPPITVCK